MFAVYAPKANMDVRYVDDILSVCNAKHTRKSRLVFTEINSADVINTTASTLRQCNYPSSPISR
jgi:hypothetical protein